VVTLQFDLGERLDVAEQEVQAAMNAADALLPADLPAPPIYAKVNPADTPVITLAITSKTMPLTEVQRLVDTRLAQKLSQVAGVGLVRLAGDNVRRFASRPTSRRWLIRGSRSTPSAPLSTMPTRIRPKAASMGRPAPTRSMPMTSC